MSEILSAALKYASMGLKVNPVHGILNGQCTCKNPDCPKPGKHPASKHSFKDGTTDPEKLQKLFHSPHFNIGLCTGKETNIVVLDIDPRNQGDESLETFEEEYGVLPETLMAKTGGGGTHYFFRYPAGNEISSKSDLLPGIDIRANGGYAIIEPSLHESGQPYAFDIEDELDLSTVNEMPKSLIDLYNRHSDRRKPERVLERSGKISEGNRNQSLTSLAGKLRHTGISIEAMTDALLTENTLRCSPPLAESEVRQIAKSISRYPVNRSAIHPPKVNDRMFTGPLGDIVRKTKGQTEAHPVALYLQLITAFGNLVGSSPHFRVGPAMHRCNVFMCLVGKTAKGRKGLSWDHARAIMSWIDPTWEKEQIQSGLSSGEGLIQRLQNQVKENNDSRLLVVETEFAQVLKQHERSGNTLSAVLRQAWDCNRLQTMTRTEPLMVDDHLVSIVAHITKNELDRVLSESDKYNGLGNRFLWCFTERPQLIPNPKPFIKSNFLSEVERLKTAQKNASQLQEVGWSNEAQIRWESIYTELNQEVNDIFDALTTRGEPYVRRMAMILALAENSKIIQLHHLDSAYEIWNYLSDSVAYIFCKEVHHKDQKKLLGAIQRSGLGLTKTECHKVFNNHRSSHALDTMLDQLISDGFVELQEYQLENGQIDRYKAT